MRIRLKNTTAQLWLIKKDLPAVTARRTDAAETQMLRLRERMEAINPLGVLKRGYSLVMDLSGRLVTEPQQACEARDISIRFANGAVNATVKKDGVRLI